MIYKIALADGRTAYMSGEENATYCIIEVSMQRFLQVWDENQRDNRYPADWFQPKYSAVNKLFSCGISNPVSPAIGGEYFDYVLGIKRLRLVDGTTRTQWLLDNGALEFPLFFLHRQHSEMLTLIGANFR